ncbi:Penicillinase repressor [Thermomonospora echinospora]|uniref:Penicillinase repressor n=1 Tax=Thermomonospora echinospora TaxID=1992 RepID=A0A1H6C2R0_9ACTN|nr:Penicillinase repressor [Thermomonospora echinospora]
MLAALAALERPAGAAELRLRLVGEPAHTTVNTVLSRLCDKRLVTRIRDGRQYLYRLAVDETRLVAGRMYDHLRFANDPRSVLSRFVQSLSADEERALRQILDASRPEPA